MRKKKSDIKVLKSPGIDSIRGADFEAVKGQRPLPPSHMQVNVDDSSKELFKPRFKRITSFVKR